MRIDYDVLRIRALCTYLQLFGVSASPCPQGPRSQREIVVNWYHLQKCHNMLVPLECFNSLQHFTGIVSSITHTSNAISTDVLISKNPYFPTQRFLLLWVFRHVPSAPFPYGDKTCEGNGKEFALPLLSTLPDIWRLFLFFLFSSSFVVFFVLSDTMISESFSRHSSVCQTETGPVTIKQKAECGHAQMLHITVFSAPGGRRLRQMASSFLSHIFFSCWPVAGDKLCVANLNTASNTGSFCLHWRGRIIWKLNMKLTNPTSQQL